MNRFLMTSLALICTTGFAHEPYVAPVAYKTEQTSSTRNCWLCGRSIK